MFRSIITLFVALAAISVLLPSTTDATPLPFRMAKRGNVLSNASSEASTGNKVLSARDFNCNVENVQCCQQLLSRNEATKSLGGLLNLPLSAVGNVGLSCTPLLISALSQCKSTPVCCSQVTQSGAVNAGCTPLSVI
ncbi:hypothetical protein P389DRAFT_197605 [Cystobasidium minutum MCA 4210]|uniref:uncharacterized protein n=1 Tax=Cystobasidium minutum MCA 4210 TaxID=1397322 RepID=UPI0034CD8688|eukprot:jgi/Rhomi1/197605/gm1.5819_g